MIAHEKPKRTKQEALDELDRLLAEVRRERENGCDFSIIWRLTKEQIELIDSVFSVQEEIKQIEKTEKDMRSYILRGETAEIKPIVLDAHEGRCDICGMNNLAILQVHHILPLKEEGGNDYDNFSVLCPNCHVILHKMMGTANADRDSKMGEWLSENYSRNANERLMNLFARYCRKKYGKG